MLHMKYYDKPTERLVTAEAVRAGHPDKFCDRIADAILDAHLKKDPQARVAVEVLVSQDKVLIAGEVTSKADVKYNAIVAQAIDDVGYSLSDLCSSDDDTFELEVQIHEQSPDIAKAVNGNVLGAGDQGIMVGYATNETPEFMPLPVVLAQRICQELDAQRCRIRGLCADGKAQVTVLYRDDHPVAVTDIVVSVQHKKGTNLTDLRATIMEDVVLHVIPKYLWTKETSVRINEAGPFILGGPAADTGLTGRKLAVDQYGPVAHIGGGAFSGKDATKVDRSGAYMARFIAKTIVSLDLASRCEVQLAYAIGKPDPVNVMVDTMGTGIMPDDVIARAVQDTFRLDVAAIIERFGLQRPIYSPLTAYGHFGRNDFVYPWEIADNGPRFLIACLQRFREVWSDQTE